MSLSNIPPAFLNELMDHLVSKGIEQAKPESAETTSICSTFKDDVMGEDVITI